MTTRVDARPPLPAMERPRMRRTTERQGGVGGALACAAQQRTALASCPTLVLGPEAALRAAQTRTQTQRKPEGAEQTAAAARLEPPASEDVRLLRRASVGQLAYAVSNVEARAGGRETADFHEAQRAAENVRFAVRLQTVLQRDDRRIRFEGDRARRASSGRVEERKHAAFKRHMSTSEVPRQVPRDKPQTPRTSRPRSRTLSSNCLPLPSPISEVDNASSGGASCKGHQARTAPRSRSRSHLCVTMTTRTAIGSALRHQASSLRQASNIGQGIQQPETHHPRHVTRTRCEDLNKCGTDADDSLVLDEEPEPDQGHLQENLASKQERVLRPRLGTTACVPQPDARNHAAAGTATSVASSVRERRASTGCVSLRREMSNPQVLQKSIQLCNSLQLDTRRVSLKRRPSSSCKTDCDASSEASSPGLELSPVE